MGKSILNFFVFFFASSLAYGQGAFSAKYSPEKNPKVILMKNETAFLKKSAPDFWALISFVEGMHTGHSASAASMAAILNSFRKDHRYSSSDEMVTEEGLLKKVTTESWASAVSDQTPKELSLNQMVNIARASFTAYDLKNAKAQAVSISDDSKSALEHVRSVLIQNEKSDHDFIIAHYMQSEFTGDPEGAVGTWSLIGAFDAPNDRVLVLETDRKYYEPYWVSLKTFMQGLVKLKDKQSGKSVGGLLLLTRS